MREKRIDIEGLGYVGLVTVACFSYKGSHFTCIGADREKLDSLKSGKVPVYEPHLGGYLSEGIASNGMVLTHEAENVLTNSDTACITVGTPSAPGGSADLGHPSSAACSAGLALMQHEKHPVFVVKSTVPLGTTEGIKRHDRLR